MSASAVLLTTISAAKTLAGKATAGSIPSTAVVSWDRHTGLIREVRPYDMLSNAPPKVRTMPHEKASTGGGDYPRALPLLTRPSVNAAKLLPERRDRAEQVDRRRALDEVGR